MGRYAYHGQEVLKRDGKLVGFNAGYGFYAEHESGYTGTEQMKPKKIIDKIKIIRLMEKLLKILKLLT